VKQELECEQPLVKALETTPETHGPRGVGYAELAPARRPLEREEAATWIVELARARPGEILLVTLGPLTNLAVALEREPSLPNLLAGWVLMGGAYRTAGNTTPTSEWNIHVDPHAAKASFDKSAELAPKASDGERRYLTDAELDTAREDAKKVMDEFCAEP